MHQNAFGGRALSGPAGGAIALPRPPSRYWGEKGRAWGGRGGEGKEGRQGRERGREMEGEGMAVMPANLTDNQFASAVKLAWENTE